jgi:hypothetical protein
MKINVCIGLAIATVSLFSCSESNLDKEELVGRWQLSKKEDKNSKSIDLKNSPTVLILNLQKNGYFIYYDSVVNESWRKTGVPLIQVQSRGQWTLVGKDLTLTDSDQNTVENLTIDSFDDNSMVTKSASNEAKVFTTYGRK